MRYNIAVPKKRVQKIQPFKIAFNFSFDGLIISFLDGFVNMQTHKMCDLKWGDFINIKILRAKANLNQKQLAKKLDVNQGTVSRWETNEMKPSKKYIKRLCKIFGCTVDELMGGGEK